MTPPHVLLLTSHPPGSFGIGGEFLGDLALHYPHSAICCFAVTLPKNRRIAPEFDWLPIRYGDIPRQSGIRRWGKAAEQVTALPARMIGKLIRFKRQIKAAIEFGRQYNVEVVLAVLDHPAIIQMAREVTGGLHAQLVTIVWDPPELLMDELGYDRISQKITLREFGHLLPMSVGIGVASENMGGAYKQRYNTDSHVLIHCPAFREKKRPPGKSVGHDQFLIGFAGSLYATEPWNTLLAALDHIDWSIEGRKVIIRVLSNNLNLRTQGRMNIEFLGWRPVDETIESLSECDIAYLPYWFDARHRLAVRLCFPNKLSTYLAANLPILFHGPADSSPSQFLQRFPLGLVCHSLAETDVLNTIQQFIVDKEFYIQALQAIDMAHIQEINEQTFYNRFAQIMGVDPSELLP